MASFIEMQRKEESLKREEQTQAALKEMTPPAERPAIERLHAGLPPLPAASAKPPGTEDHSKLPAFERLHLGLPPVPGQS